MGIKCDKKSEGGRTVIKIGGEVTVYEVEELKGVLLEAFDKEDEVLLDLSDVSDCDTAGIQILVSAEKTAEKMGKVFYIVDISQSVREAGDRIGLDMPYRVKPINEVSDDKVHSDG